MSTLLKVAMTFTINTNIEIRKIQEKNVTCHYMISNLQVGKNKVLERKFEIVKGVMYRKPTKKVPTSRIVIPNTKFPDTFKQYHIDIYDGPFGIDKTMTRINQYFWHPLLNRIVEDKVRSCDECQRKKGLVSQKSTAHIPKIGSYPMEKIRTNICRLYDSRVIPSNIR